MNERTENAVRAVLRTDPDYNPLLTDAAVAVLKGKSPATLQQVEKLDHVISRQQAAQVLNVHINTIDRLARLGQLKRVRGSGMKALGISAESLRAFEARQHENFLKVVK